MGKPNLGICLIYLNQEKAIESCSRDRIQWLPWPECESLSVSVHFVTFPWVLPLGRCTHASTLGNLIWFELTVVSKYRNSKAPNSFAFLPSVFMMTVVCGGRLFNLTSLPDTPPAASIFGGWLWGDRIHSSKSEQKETCYRV